MHLKQQLVNSKLLKQQHNHSCQQSSDEQTNQSQLARSRWAVLKIHKGIKQLQQPQPEKSIISSLQQNPNQSNVNWQLQNSGRFGRIKSSRQSQSPFNHNNDQNFSKLHIKNVLQELYQYITTINNKYSIVISRLQNKINNLQRKLSQFSIQRVKSFRQKERLLFERQNQYQEEIEKFRQKVYKLQRQLQKEKQKNKYYQSKLVDNDQKIFRLYSDKDQQKHTVQNLQMKSLLFYKQQQKKQYGQQKQQQQQERSLLQGIDEELQWSTVRVPSREQSNNNNGSGQYQSRRMSGQVAMPVTVQVNKNMGQKIIKMKRKVESGPKSHSQQYLYNKFQTLLPSPSTINKLQQHNRQNSQQIMIVDEQLLSQLSNSNQQNDVRGGKYMVRNDRLIDGLNVGEQQDGENGNDRQIVLGRQESQVERFNIGNTLSNNPFQFSKNHYQSSNHQKVIKHNKQTYNIPSIINISQLQQQGYNLSNQQKYLLKEIRQLRRVVQGQQWQQQCSSQQVMIKSINGCGKQQKRIVIDGKSVGKQLLQGTEKKVVVGNSKIGDVKSTIKKTTTKNNSINDRLIKANNDFNTQQKQSTSSEITNNNNKKLSQLTNQLQMSQKRQYYLQSVLLHLKQTIKQMRNDLYQLLPCQYCGLRGQLMDIV